MDVLVCDTSGNVKLPPGEPGLAQSPISCFDMAVDGQYGFIVVRFGKFNLKQRDTLLDLCSALKRNQHTRQIPVLALLAEKHRVVVERLARAGVEYLKVVEPNWSRPELTWDSFQNLGPDDSPATILTEMCPHLRYQAIALQDEMVVCRVHRGRLILGGARLKELCETKEHLTCEYYLKTIN